MGIESICTLPARIQAQIPDQTKVLATLNESLARFLKIKPTQVHRDPSRDERHTSANGDQNGSVDSGSEWIAY